MTEFFFFFSSFQALTTPCVLAGLAGGAAYFGSMELDATKPIMVRGLSSIIVHHSSRHRVLTRFSFSAAQSWVAWARTCLHSFVQFPRSPPFLYPGAGYLVGPIIGSALWRVTHRRTMTLIEARDREFHQHVVRNRVDPRAQSATNPVPDFYGEQAPNSGVTVCMDIHVSRGENRFPPSI